MLNSKLERIEERLEALEKVLESCTLCPHRCKVNRWKGEVGFCKVDHQLRIASYGPHFGEERQLVGRKGSGTIFFLGCNMSCVFCQNYEISQNIFEPADSVISTEGLADIFFEMKYIGCHNVNLVTPTHFVPQIVKALVIAIRRGFDLPIVYNCGGYESTETLQQLDGIIDIYMPDAKYGNSDLALKYSGVRDYTMYLFAALKEMHRQVGDLCLDSNGVAVKGLLVRHLVMPDDIAGSKTVLTYIAESISRNTTVNVMEQYHPAFKAASFPEINRALTNEEFQEVLAFAQSLGLKVI